MSAKVIAIIVLLILLLIFAGEGEVNEDATFYFTFPIGEDI
jgi:hypothetical protein